MQSERNLFRPRGGEAVVRRIVTLSAVALLLAACAPEAPGGGESAPPADAPVEAPPPAADAGAAFRVDFSARGTEPFWGVDIKGTDIVLTRPDAGPATAANAGLAATESQAIWTAQAGATPVTVTVTKGDCSDGMSDLKYGYTAEVVWGAETLKGCGFPTAEQPREGQ
jgi:uncharacterized membrane protein